MTQQEFMAQVAASNPGEPEFIQAVEEVVSTVWDVYQANPKFVAANVLGRMVEPERTIIFRIPWVDDQGAVHVNKGYRVQFNSAIGPYKGGVRLHPSVNLSVLKFLGFEQTLKNSLSTLPLGGGKGGSDFNARGRSDGEIMRFCQSMMMELWRHIGPNLDVPAGDIGVGAREVGYMYGMYKKLANEFTGTFTGKGRTWGGSIIRPEATGFGAVYYLNGILSDMGQTLEGKRIAVSGFGNVAWGVCQKATEFGGKVVTLSGPDGYIYDEEGINTPEKWQCMVDLRTSNNDRIGDYVKTFPKAKFFPGQKPWVQKVDIAMPCATQNEVNLDDAKALIANKLSVFCEVANMPCTADAAHAFNKARIPFGPGKAANAGGVSVSGLEMSQNSMRYSWTAEEVDAKLQQIMTDIHAACVQYGTEPDGYIDYAKGANIAGFMKVAQAVLEQGIV
ncbi:MAG: NADP-specific glutamate dehydrogenase [Candidatus Cloacimonadales bacterium]